MTAGPLDFQNPLSLRIDVSATGERIAAAMVDFAQSAPLYVKGAQPFAPLGHSYGKIRAHISIWGGHGRTRFSSSQDKAQDDLQDIGEDR